MFQRFVADLTGKLTNALLNNAKADAAAPFDSKTSSATDSTRSHSERRLSGSDLKSPIKELDIKAITEVVYGQHANPLLNKTQKEAEKLKDQLENEVSLGEKNFFSDEVVHQRVAQQKRDEKSNDTYDTPYRYSLVASSVAEITSLNEKQKHNAQVFEREKIVFQQRKRGLDVSYASLCSHLDIWSEKTDRNANSEFLKAKKDADHKKSFAKQLKTIDLKESTWSQEIRSDIYRTFQTKYGAFYDCIPENLETLDPENPYNFAKCEPTRLPGRGGYPNLYTSNPAIVVQQASRTKDTSLMDEAKKFKEALENYEADLAILFAKNSANDKSLSKQIKSMDEKFASDHKLLVDNTKQLLKVYKDTAAKLKDESQEFYNELCEKKNRFGIPISKQDKVREKIVSDVKEMGDVIKSFRRAMASSEMFRMRAIRSIRSYDKLTSAVEKAKAAFDAGLQSKDDIKNEYKTARERFGVYRDEQAQKFEKDIEFFLRDPGNNGSLSKFIHDAKILIEVNKPKIDDLKNILTAENLCKTIERSITDKVDFWHRQVAWYGSLSSITVDKRNPKTGLIEPTSISVPNGIAQIHAALRDNTLSAIEKVAKIQAIAQARSEKMVAPGREDTTAKFYNAIRGDASCRNAICESRNLASPLEEAARLTRVANALQNTFGRLEAASDENGSLQGVNFARTDFSWKQPRDRLDLSDMPDPPSMPDIIEPFSRGSNGVTAQPASVTEVRSGSPTNFSNAELMSQYGIRSKNSDNSGAEFKKADPSSVRRNSLSRN